MKYRTVKQIIIINKPLQTQILVFSESLLMFQSTLVGSRAKYLIDEKGAEEADYEDLICVHQAAKVLLQLIDQAMCRKMEEERYYSPYLR